MKLSACLIAFSLLLVASISAQQFGAQQVITNSANQAQGVYATDLDGDGDADVLSASFHDDKIAWYENTGGGTFGPQQVITTNTVSATSVYATDIDGDGDPDVLSASQNDDKIAWYENLGGGSFGLQQVITTNANGAHSVYAADLDGDGDADVLSTSHNDDKIAWYKNLTPHSATYPGSDADLQLAIGVNATLTPLLDIHPVSAGDVLHLLFSSPGGAYNLTPPLLVAQAFPTGSTPIGPVLFPEVHIGTGALAPYPAIVIYDGTGVPGMYPALPPTGFHFANTVAPSLAPISIMLQGFWLAPNPNNPIFTTTDAHEIQIQ